MFHMYILGIQKLTSDHVETKPQNLPKLQLLLSFIVKSAETKLDDVTAAILSHCCNKGHKPLPLHVIDRFWLMIIIW